MNVDPIRLVQAHELLKAAQEHHEDAGRKVVADRAFEHGRAAGAAEAAADALFEYVNVCSSYLDDGEAAVVLNEHLTRHDPPRCTCPNRVAGQVAGVGMDPDCPVHKGLAAAS